MAAASFENMKLSGFGKLNSDYFVIERVELQVLNETSFCETIIYTGSLDVPLYSGFD